MSAFGAGAIWKSEIRFPDNFRLKYCILLNTCTNASDQLVLALTTSHGDRYCGETSCQCGCPAVSCYRLNPRQVPCFPVTTWVQFDNLIREWTPNELEARKAAGAAEYLRDLPSDLLFSVLRCAMKAIDFTGRELKLIENTLAALDAEKKRAKTAKPSTAASAQPTQQPATKTSSFADSVRGELASCGKSEADFCGVLEIPLEDFDGYFAAPVDPRRAKDARAALDLLKE